MQVRSKRMASRAARLALLVLAAAAAGSTSARAQEDEGGCVFDRRVYPEGSERCQGGARVRCRDGAWSDIGLCDDPEPDPPPISDGGDVEE